jgi:hypothetical protein
MRARWLASVVFDRAGCWIWIGPLHERGGSKYPVFVGIGANKVQSAFTWFLRLWSPADLLSRNQRYRLCGKVACVRPACATRAKGAVHADPRFRPVDWAAVEAAVRGGATTRDIRDKYGVHSEKLLEHLNGVGMRLKRSRRALEWIPLAMQLYARGVSQQEIGARVGVNQSTISYHARRENWPRGKPPVPGGRAEPSTAASGDPGAVSGDA